MPRSRQAYGQSPWWWILGHHADSDVWHPLYSFRPEQRLLARSMLGYLLTMEPGTKTYEEHIEYDDFKLESPDEDADAD